eukprot:4776451-Pyramimonas_sp.AAC.1
MGIARQAPLSTRALCLKASTHQFVHCGEKWRCDSCMQLVDDCRLDETAFTQSPGPPPVPSSAARQLSRLGEALVVEAGGRELNGQSAHPSHRLVEIPKWR